MITQKLRPVLLLHCKPTLSRNETERSRGDKTKAKDEIKPDQIGPTYISP